MSTRRPKNDVLILELLESDRIVVLEDLDDCEIDGFGVPRPKTKIYVRNMKTRDGRLQLQTVFPKIGGHPYFSLYPSGRKNGMVWLSARRVVWYAFNRKRTNLMVCSIDGDPMNYNHWNLCLRDQNDQNYLRMAKEAMEAELEKENGRSGGGTFSDDEIPF